MSVVQSQAQDNSIVIQPKAQDSCTQSQAPAAPQSDMLGDQLAQSMEMIYRLSVASRIEINTLLSVLGIHTLEQRLRDKSQAPAAPQELAVLSDLRTRLVKMTSQAFVACGIQSNTLMSMLGIDTLEQRFRDESDKLSQIRTIESKIKTLQNLKKTAEEQRLLDKNNEHLQEQIVDRLLTLHQRLTKIFVQTSSISGIKMNTLAKMVGIEALQTTRDKRSGDASPQMQAIRTIFESLKYMICNEQLF